MFHIGRTRQLQSVKWHTDPDRETGKSIFFIEGRVLSQPNPAVNDPTSMVTSDGNYRKGWLRDDEVISWLDSDYDGRHNTITRTSSPSQRQEQQPVVKGGFRLLICERFRHHTDNTKVAMSQASFLHVEKEFKLSPATLPSLFSMCGVYSKHVTRNDKTNRIESMDLVMKVTQKVEVANHLLSIHCDFETGWIYGFLCGQGCAVPQAWDDRYGNSLGHIIEVVEGCMELWLHPLMFPAALVQNCCNRTVVTRDKLSDRLVQLEVAIGVTFAGQAHHQRSLENWPADINMKEVTIGLHSVGAQIIFVGHVSSWICEVIPFLLEVMKEIEDKISCTRQDSAKLRSYLEHELCLMVNVDRFIKSYKERTQAQTNVLYSASSQKDNATAISYSRIAHTQNDLARKDNQLNIKIAMLTKRDSVAMIAFTFITAMFLPGTAIATIFSMPMFDWRDSPGSISVSTNFWVYWVVTIPLTTTVMIAWYLWYRHKNKQWQNETEVELKKKSN